LLREIGTGRKDGNRGFRRWFQDEYFDLYVWYDAADTPLAFQLCYDRTRNEGAITWDDVAGFAHDRVDAREDSPKRAMTPILRAYGTPPYFRVYNRFLEASAACPPALREFLTAKLRAYRIVLYGEPRKPRRPRSAAADRLQPIDSASRGE
jgi:hypothetical protein